MATTLKRLLVVLGLIIFVFGCATSNETIILCDKKYDVYKSTGYNYEQKLNGTVNMLCFHNSKIIAFAYQTAGFRNSDTNLVYTILKHQNDSLIITTYQDSAVHGYKHQSTRYFRCTKNGFISLNSSGNPDYYITKKTARKNKSRLKRK